MDGTEPAIGRGCPLPGGFDRDLGQHRLVFQRGGPTLIVSFDHAGRPAEGDYATRPAWGAGFYLGEGHSLLGVIAKKASWFRDATLIGALERLRDDGFFSRFSTVVMTGGSMGGFGAATFAAFAPGCTVIAFSPQATLDPRIAPWEDRFPESRACDWSLPYSRAAEGLSAAALAYLFFDPLDRGDQRHAGMLARHDSVITAPIPAGGHGVQPMLVMMGLLKPVTQSCIAGTFDRPGFLRAIRARKTTLRYHRMLVREALMRDKPGMALRLCDKAIRAYPAADFREMKSLALSRLGRPGDAFSTMLVARTVLTNRLKG